MILIGNGPLPFAVPGTGAQSVGAPSRATTVQQGAAQPETIPAATPERSGQASSAPEAATHQAALRPVLATSRLDATETDPNAMFRQAAKVSANADACTAAEGPDPRRDPIPPLKSYANVPSEITAEIQRLRQENAELKAEMAAMKEADKAEAGEPPPSGPMEDVHAEDATGPEQQPNPEQEAEPAAQTSPPKQPPDELPD